MRMREWWLFGWILVLTLSAVALLADSAGETAGGSGGAVMSLSTQLEPEAAAKVDPRIRFAMAIRAHAPEAIAPMGRRIVVLGKTADELEFPVLVRTRLSDAELAAIGAPPDSRVGNIVTSKIAISDMERVAADPGVEAIEASAWLDNKLNVSIPEVRANLINQGSPPTGYTGAGVIFGLVDDGIDITHADFKNAQNTSRILYIWDHYYNGNPPAGFGYGVEYTKTQIDAGQAYQFVNSGGHGSHVAGIAVGDGSSLAGNTYRGVAADADIIAVRNGYCDMFCYGGGMPPYGNADTRGSIDGLNYLLQKKTQLGKPMIVNQSQGVTMGPHDGTTLFETAYDEMIQNDGLIICVASGNDEQHDWHGRATVSPGGSANIVVNHDTSEGGVAVIQWECWYRQGDQFTWRLTNPGGSYLDINASYPPSQYPGYAFPGQQDTLWYWTTTSSAINGQGYASFWVQNRRVGVQGGNWTVRAAAANNLPAGGVVDLYCERNQSTVTVTQGLYTDGIVGMPGTCTGVITVASYNTKNSWNSLAGQQSASGYTVGDISRFSSWGPRRDGAEKPDISAPGAWIMSAFAAGSDPNNDYLHLRDPQDKHICFTGTSMASPHVAGAVALMLQKDPTLTPTEVKQILKDTARTDAYTGSVWNKKFGYGKLDVKAAVDEVGGSSACPTRSGDADGNNTVNVLDLVATVNDILGTQPLGTGGRACADVDGNSQINILDVVSIVNIILGFVQEPLASPAADAPAEAPVAWALQADEEAVVIEIDARAVAGVQLTLVPPRGYRIAGEPAILRGAPGAEIAGSTPRGMQKIVCFNSSGGALAEAGDRLVIEVPMRQEWHGGQGASDARVVAMQLSDLHGRPAEAWDTPIETLQGFVAAGPYSMTRMAPNPARGASRISYRIDRSGSVDVEVFDPQGRKIRTLWSGWQMAGEHVINWDGRTDAGVETPAGIYFVRLTGENDTESRKLTLIR